MLSIVVALIALALLFDFINGFHDAANSIATVVSTRVLSPLIAVLWAAFFNFIAAFGGGVRVANTMGKGIIEFDHLKAQGTHAVLAVIFAALVGAQDHDMNVLQSRTLVMKRFGLSEHQLRQIEREGVDNEWPPL